MNRFYILLIGLAFAPAPAIAQQSCASIADPAKRLSCYDAKNTNTAPSLDTSIDFDDLVTDIATLRGKNVKVNVNIKQLGNSTFGYRDDVFGPFIILDISALNRDDRKKLNKDCTAAAELCGATVSGTASNIFGHAGIKAVSIIWR